MVKKVKKSKRRIVFDEAEVEVERVVPALGVVKNKRGAPAIGVVFKPQKTKVKQFTKRIVED